MRKVLCVFRLGFKKFETNFINGKVYLTFLNYHPNDNLPSNLSIATIYPQNYQNTKGVFVKCPHTPPSIKTSTIHGRDVSFHKSEKYILVRFETSFSLFSIFTLLPKALITIRKQQARKKR
jgi:hypothetical protein